MPPKTRNAAKTPAIPLDPLYQIAATVDIASIQRSHPVFRLLQRGFREAACYNDEAKELIQETFATRVPTTPKKKREQMNQVVKTIDDVLMPAPLDFDQSVELFSSPAVASVPSRTSMATPLTRKIPQASSTPFSKSARSAKATPSTNKSATFTPSRIPKVPIKPKAVPRNYVPKAATVHRKNPAEIDQKAKEDLQKAEERRLQQLAEKTERIRAEREDRDARARERRQQIEEEKKLAAAKGQQYKNHDYAPRNIFSPRKPARDTAKKDIITPRQVHIPKKKGNLTASVTSSMASENTTNTVVASPILKRKVTSKEAAKVIPAPIPAPVQVEEQTASSEDYYDSGPIAEDGDHAPEEEEQLNYEVVNEQEALEISNACRGESSLFASFEQHEAEIQQQKEPIQMTPLIHSADIPSNIVKAKPIPETPIQEAEPVEKDSTLRDDQEDDVVEETDILQQPLPTVNIVKQEPLDMSETNTDKNKKVWLPSTADDYNVWDLESGDETDDEDKPRKEIPKWAKPRQLKAAVFALEKKMTIDERAELLGPISEPTLQSIFGRKFKNRMRKSSNQWNSPFSKPTPGFSRLPH
uniref:INCENP_ARK-bind domain-containing protein n=1 Tax=Panagrellus redivivus TaxID=6233 RepID=A0A7E4ZRY2_PANRE